MSRPTIARSAETDDVALDHVDLVLTGMSCAACAARIERTLNTLDGVTATVNFATEKAAVDFDAGMRTTDDLRLAVESIGDGASVPASGLAQNADAEGDARRRAVLRRLV